MNTKKAQNRAEVILDALINDSLSQEMVEDIRRWLASGYGSEAKAAAMYRLFKQKVAPDKEKSEKALESFRQLSERLELPQFGDEGFVMMRPGIPLNQQRYEEDSFADETGLFPDRKKPAVRPLRRTMLRVAAVVLPLLVMGGLLTYTLRSGKETPAPVAAVLTTIMAPEGGIEEKVFPDGTKVELSPNSTLSYTDQRDVALSGEARFRVAKSTDANGRPQPFTVHAAELVIKVLGTDFLVTAYDNGDFPEVALYEGSVEVTAGGAATTLRPGSKYSYDRIGGTYEVSAIRPRDMAEAGYKPSLDMYGVTLEDALHTIAANYGVTLEIAGDVDLGGNYAVNIRKDDSLEEALSVLKKLTGKFNYTIHDNTLTITKS